MRTCSKNGLLYYFPSEIYIYTYLHRIMFQFIGFIIEVQLLYQIYQYNRNRFYYIYTITTILHFIGMNNIFNNTLVDNQTIVDYERKIIQNSLQQLPKPVLSNDSKYAVWTLNQKIYKLIGNKPYTLRWIGNSNDSHIYAYAYSILMLCAQNPQSFFSFKKSLYELSIKYLESSHQKFLIQFLCLIQFSKDKYLFLKKYPIVQNILISLFKFIDEQKKIYNNSQGNQKLQNTIKSRQSSISKFREPAKNRSFSVQDEMIKSTEIAFIAKITEAYTTYGSFFNFIQMATLDTYSFSFHLKNSPHALHIVNEGESFFLLTKKQSVKEQHKKGLDKTQVNRLFQQNLVPIMEVVPKNVYPTKKTQQILQTKNTNQKYYFPKQFLKLTNLSDSKQNFSLSDKKDERQRVNSVKLLNHIQKKDQIDKKNDQSDKYKDQNCKNINQEKSKRIQSFKQDSEKGKIQQFMNIFQTSGYQSQIQKIQILDEKPDIHQKQTHQTKSNMQPFTLTYKLNGESPSKTRFIRIKSAQSSRHNSPSQRKINRQQKNNQQATDYKIITPFDKDSTAKREMHQLKLAFEKAKQKRKEQILKIDQKYHQKKQQIIKKNKINNNPETQQSKQVKKKDFFSRISLKSRADYMFGSSKNTSQFQGVGSKQIKSGKFNIYNTLSNKSENYLRKKIFNQAEQNVKQDKNQKQDKLAQRSELKRNKSHEQKAVKSLELKNAFKKVFKEDVDTNNLSSQDNQNILINVFTPEYTKHQIVNFKQAEEAFKSNNKNTMFQYSFGPKERAF